MKCKPIIQNGELVCRDCGRSFGKGATAAQLAHCGEAPPATPAVDPLACVHRGPRIETRLCDLCGTPVGKGNPFEVLKCDLYGECSLHRLHSKVRSCAACPDRTSLPPAAAKPCSLTISMACYDDFYGVEKTVSNLQQFHGDALDDVEILVVDNNPKSDHGRETAEFLRKSVPNGRYVPFTERVGSTCAREEVFRRAAGKWTLCCDAHVSFNAGVIQRLREFIAANGDSVDLHHGPLMSNREPATKIVGTHMRPEWKSEMFGRWGVDPRGADPEAPAFDIPMHGLFAFFCQTDAWLGFSPHFRGFSGGEFYVHEKFRQAGRRVLCLPWFRAVHRFQQVGGRKYPLRWQDKIRNHLVGWLELGTDIEPIRQHWVNEQQKLSAAEFQRMADEAQAVSGNLTP